MTFAREPWGIRRGRDGLYYQTHKKTTQNSRRLPLWGEKARLRDFSLQLAIFLVLRLTGSSKGYTYIHIYIYVYVHVCRISIQKGCGGLSFRVVALCACSGFRAEGVGLGSGFEKRRWYESTFYFDTWPTD